MPPSPSLFFLVEVLLRREEHQLRSCPSQRERNGEASSYSRAEGRSRARAATPPRGLREDLPSLLGAWVSEPGQRKIAAPRRCLYREGIEQNEPSRKASDTETTTTRLGSLNLEKARTQRLADPVRDVQGRVLQRSVAWLEVGSRKQEVEGKKSEENPGEGLASASRLSSPASCFAASTALHQQKCTFFLRLRRGTSHVLVLKRVVDSTRRSLDAS